MIQWAPGDGWGEQQDWTELYRRIDSPGKGLILGGSLERMKKFWREFRSRKIFYTTTAETPDAARRIPDSF